jgi:hypothetical protein
MSGIFSNILYFFHKFIDIWTLWGGGRVENFKILENNVISVETRNHQRTTTTTMVLEIHTVQKCTLHIYSATAGEILKKNLNLKLSNLIW